MGEELIHLTQNDVKSTEKQDAYPDASSWPAFIELYRYQVPVDRRLIFKPGHTFSLYAGLLADQAVDGAVALDAEVATEQAAEANEDTTNDVTLTPATPAVNDEYHFGYRYPFSGLTVKYTTACADADQTVAWEYSRVAALTAATATWAAVAGLTDGSTGWVTAAGTKDIIWTMPLDWVQTTVDGKRMYWIRCRVSAVGTTPNQATGDQVWINPDPTAMNDTDLVKIELRDQNELTRRPILPTARYSQVTDFTDRDKLYRLDIAEPAIAKAGDWVVVLVKALGVVDVSECYFDLTCDREMGRLF